MLPFAITPCGVCDCSAHCVRLRPRNRCGSLRRLLIPFYFVALPAYILWNRAELILFVLCMGRTAQSILGQFLLFGLATILLYHEAHTLQGGFLAPEEAQSPNESQNATTGFHHGLPRGSAESESSCFVPPGTPQPISPPAARHTTHGGHGAADSHQLVLSVWQIHQEVGEVLRQMWTRSGQVLRATHIHAMAAAMGRQLGSTMAGHSTVAAENTLTSGPDTVTPRPQGQAQGSTQGQGQRQRWRGRQRQAQSKGQSHCRASSSRLFIVATAADSASARGTQFSHDDNRSISAFSCAKQAGCPDGCSPGFGEHPHSGYSGNTRAGRRSFRKGTLPPSTQSHHCPTTGQNRDWPREDSQKGLFGLLARLYQSARGHARTTDGATNKNPRGIRAAGEEVVPAVPRSNQGDRQTQRCSSEDRRTPSPTWRSPRRRRDP